MNAIQDCPHCLFAFRILPEIFQRCPTCNRGIEVTKYGVLRRVSDEELQQMDEDLRQPMRGGQTTGFSPENDVAQEVRRLKVKAMQRDEEERRRQDEETTSMKKTLRELQLQILLRQKHEQEVLTLAKH